MTVRETSVRGKLPVIHSLGGGVQRIDTGRRPFAGRRPPRAAARGRGRCQGVRKAGLESIQSVAYVRAIGGPDGKKRQASSDGRFACEFVRRRPSGSVRVPGGKRVYSGSEKHARSRPLRLAAREEHDTERKVKKKILSY
jgi:hypothetical protein